MVCMRTVATGFRASVTYGLIMWLQRTGQRFRADPQPTWDAAQVYLQSGQREYPFAEAEAEDVDWEDDPTLHERPHRQEAFAPAVQRRLVFELDSSESSSSGSAASTIEPSLVEVSSETASSEARVVPGEGTMTNRGSVLSSTLYRSVEGGPVVQYVDDQALIPLPGWGLLEVQAIVLGMNSGDWSEFQRLLEQKTLDPLLSSLRREFRLLQGPGIPCVSGVERADL